MSVGICLCPFVCVCGCVRVKDGPFRQLSVATVSVRLSMVGYQGASTGTLKNQSWITGGTGPSNSQSAEKSLRKRQVRCIKVCFYESILVAALDSLIGLDPGKRVQILCVPKFTPRKWQVLAAKVLETQRGRARLAVLGVHASDGFIELSNAPVAWGIPYFLLSLPMPICLPRNQKEEP